MKYMGSKRAMLRNGLGEILSEVVPQSQKFFDLFCGTGSVAGFVSMGFDKQVHAGDLQTYAVALTRVQIEQLEQFDASMELSSWTLSADSWLDAEEVPLDEALALECASRESTSASAALVKRMREFCAELPLSFPVARAYGGHYFSAFQAIRIDALRACVSGKRSAARLAALLDAASSCAAAPGHTAQPFAPSESGLPHLLTAWDRSIDSLLTTALHRVSRHAANIKGCATQSDAARLALTMSEGDVAFVDPPYSEVQYSRFYHVLELLAVGKGSAVSGVGRYPALEERPQSSFCKTSASVSAFDQLALSIASRGGSAIVTFPAGAASNGLSGQIVEALCDQYFVVRKRKVASVFSTLGGNLRNRNARQGTTELVLYVVPR